MENQEQFSRLVIQYQGKVRAFIRMLGAAPDAVDDLAQDTMVVAYKRLNTLDCEENASKWLNGIARNIVRNELRKSSRRRIVNAQLTEVLLRVEDDQTGLETRLQWIGLLRDCLGNLPPSSRKMVSGRYRQGLKSAELGEQHGMTAAAVRQMLTRIRGQLKLCIERRLQEA